MTKVFGAPLPKWFATFAEAEVILGVPRTALYNLAHEHPEILIRFHGRSLIYLEPAAAIILQMPRGPRKVSGGGKGRVAKPLKK